MSTLGGGSARLLFRSDRAQILLPESLLPQKVFTERLPTFVEPWARMTTRCCQHITSIGLATCGKGGARVAARLGIQTTRPTILRRIMDLPDVSTGSVVYLGIDDFSFRRGYRFGTILVNLESHRVVDLLPDRRAETAAEWMFYANQQQQAINNGNALLGPSLGALLFLQSGAAWALLFDTLSFGILCLCLLAITVPQGAQVQKDSIQQRPFRQEFFDGLRFFKENRRLITITVSCTLLFLGAGAHNALDVFFVTQNLHTNAGFYGILSSFYALGLIIGSLLSSVFIAHMGNVRAFCGGILLWGIFMLLYARLESPIIALGVVLLLGFSNAVFNVAVAPLILSITPREFIGRVTSVFTTAMTVASLLSVSISSFFASTVLHNFHETLFGMPIGSIDTIFTCVGIFALLGGWYSAMNLGNSAQKKDTVPTDV